MPAVPIDTHDEPVVPPETPPPTYTDLQLDDACFFMQQFAAKVRDMLYAANEIKALQFTAITFEGPGFTDPTMYPNFNDPNDPFAFLVPLGNLIQIPELPPGATKYQRFEWIKEKFQQFLDAHPLAKELFGLWNPNGIPLGPLNIKPTTA